MDSIGFDDYYEDLQVSSNADSETIDRIYRLLAKRYHPDNPHTGNIETFKNLTNAHEILSHPERRAAYDVSYEEKKTRQWQAISEITSPEGYTEDAHNRRCMLSILYIKCREKPSEPGIGLWRLEKMLGWPENVMEFHYWYLKEKGYIKRNEDGQLSITVTGADKVEQDGVAMGKDLLLSESAEANHKLKFLAQDNVTSVKNK